MHLILKAPHIPITHSPSLAHITPQILNYPLFLLKGTTYSLLFSLVPVRTHCSSNLPHATHIPLLLAPCSTQLTTHDATSDHEFSFH